MAESADAIGTVFTVGDRPIRKGGDWYYFLLQLSTKKDFLCESTFFCTTREFFVSPGANFPDQWLRKKRRSPKLFLFLPLSPLRESVFLEEEKLPASKRLNLPLRNANFSAVFANICAWQKPFFAPPQKKKNSPLCYFGFPCICFHLKQKPPKVSFCEEGGNKKSSSISPLGLNLIRTSIFLCL